MEVGYNSCKRAHAALVAKGLPEKPFSLRRASVDEFGTPGTRAHMLAEREAEIARFKGSDKRNTKWREKSWANLSDAARG